MLWSVYVLGAFLQCGHEEGCMLSGVVSVGVAGEVGVGVVGDVVDGAIGVVVG